MLADGPLPAPHPRKFYWNNFTQSKICNCKKNFPERAGGRPMSVTLSLVPTHNHDGRLDAREAVSLASSTLPVLAGTRAEKSTNRSLIPKINIFFERGLKNNTAPLTLGQNI